jgi:hypothetical protein
MSSVETKTFMFFYKEDEQGLLLDFIAKLKLGTCEFLLEDDIFVLVTPFDREAEKLIAKYINKIYIK